jgi:BirA family biotin operon repressor/biotin-[acetyl-CoA-carboxylase] ligase
MTAPLRPPLDVETLRRAVMPPWVRIDVVDEVDSTNAALMGSAPGTVLVAEHQSAGRGRLDRSWVAPPRAGVTMSAVLRPSSVPATWGWLPLLAGVALWDAAGSDSSLKWPNDLLLGPRQRKVAGILAQVSGDAVVLGIGLNVTTTREELPVETATSLAIEGRDTDRTHAVVMILDAVGARFLQWQDALGDAEACGLAEAYRDACSTIGQDVTVTGTDGSVRSGRAVGIDSGGRLELATEDGRFVVAAGDVHHLRPIAEIPPANR